MRAWLAAASWAALGLSAVAAAAGGPSTPAGPASPPVTPGVAAKPAAAPAVEPISLVRMVIRLPQGSVYANVEGGLFCLPSRKLTWTGGQKDIRSIDFVNAFHTEIEKAGLKVEGDPNNLFEPSAIASDLVVGGVITGIESTYCAPNVAIANVIKGALAMDIEWQVYSKIRKSVLIKVSTHGAFELKKPSSGNLDSLLLGAFSDNVRALAADGSFRKALTGAAQAGDVLRPTSQASIPLAGSLASQTRSISDAVASVVLIYAGSGHGSGFLASSDGLLLTDQHVVGGDKFVKVRWPDGIETLGEVIRSDKVRDVALVKTDPRGRRPLRLRRDAMQPGDTVFAIGAPIDEKFQSTVTRGVVSANRTFEGLSYIQSDVSVNPGSSGGPLLDEKGEVVGLTESGYRIAGAPAEINLFTPLGDALEFLSAEPR